MFKLYNILISRQFCKTWAGKKLNLSRNLNIKSAFSQQFSIEKSCLLLAGALLPSVYLGSFFILISKQPDGEHVCTAGNINQQSRRRLGIFSVFCKLSRLICHSHQGHVRTETYSRETFVMGTHPWLLARGGCWQGL